MTVAFLRDFRLGVSALEPSVHPVTLPIQALQ